MVKRRRPLDAVLHLWFTSDTSYIQMMRAVMVNHLSGLIMMKPIFAEHARLVALDFTGILILVNPLLLFRRSHLAAAKRKKLSSLFMYCF